MNWTDFIEPTIQVIAIVISVTSGLMAYFNKQFTSLRESLLEVDRKQSEEYHNLELRITQLEGNVESLEKDIQRINSEFKQAIDKIDERLSKLDEIWEIVIRQDSVVDSMTDKEYVEVSTCSLTRNHLEKRVDTLEEDMDRRLTELSNAVRDINKKLDKLLLSNKA